MSPGLGQVLGWKEAWVQQGRSEFVGGITLSFLAIPFTPRHGWLVCGGSSWASRIPDNVRDKNGNKGL